MQTSSWRQIKCLMYTERFHHGDDYEFDPHSDGTRKDLGEGGHDHASYLKDFPGALWGSPRVFHTTSWMVVTTSTHMYGLSVLNTQNLSASYEQVMFPYKVEEIPQKVFLHTKRAIWHQGEDGSSVPRTSMSLPRLVISMSPS